jgi:hypothetical protein
MSESFNVVRIDALHEKGLDCFFVRHKKASADFADS